MSVYILYIVQTFPRFLCSLAELDNLAVRLFPAQECGSNRKVQIFRLCQRYRQWTPAYRFNDGQTKGNGTSLLSPEHLPFGVYKEGLAWSQLGGRCRHLSRR